MINKDTCEVNMITPTSSFWKKLNEEINLQLTEQGYENFKQTINRNYFQHMVCGIHHPFFISLLKEYIKHPTIDIFLSSISNCNGLNLKQQFFYKLFVSILWEYTKQHDYYRLNEKIDEPQQGNPIRIKYKNRYISQDLCNSIMEVNTIMTNINLPNKPNILEIGAGYGRTAYVFLKSIDCDYTIIDIPPTINISKRYLTDVLPDKNITFLGPTDMNCTPDKYFDLVINISSFQEMTPVTTQTYFNFIDRCAGYLYIKEWVKWYNSADDLVVSYADYPINPRWIKLFCRKHVIYNNFFEAMFKVAP